MDAWPILCFLSVLTACMAVNLHRRVLGGRLIGEDEHPFLVSLWFMPENGFTNNTGLHHVCGGTLIGASWVLTAAHCFDSRVLVGSNETDNWKVVVGKHNQRLEEDNNQFRTIKAVHMYDGWDYDTLTNDAALLELDDPVDLSRSGVAVVYFDTDPECAVPGAQCYAVGWGQAAEAPFGYGMEVPVSAAMPVIEDSVCREAYRPGKTGRYVFVINAMSLCAGHLDGEIDSCNGDSGGPLMCECNDTVVVSGIVSTGYGCGRKHLIGLYTRVVLLKDWIREVIDGNDQQPVAHPHAVL